MLKSFKPLKSINAESEDRGSEKEIILLYYHREHSKDY